MLENLRTVYLTRRERFNAAHKLWNDKWTDEKNKDIFGKCANKNWHGHNYELFVTVKGIPDAETGYAMDLKYLSGLIDELVIEPLDHKNINLDVPFMDGVMASTENLVIAIWDRLLGPVEEFNCTLHSVRLHETENNYVEYFGE